MKRSSGSESLVAFERHTVTVKHVKGNAYSLKDQCAVEIIDGDGIERRIDSLGLEEKFGVLLQQLEFKILHSIDVKWTVPMQTSTCLLLYVSK